MNEHRIRESMVGIAHRPHRYQHAASRFFAGIHRRIVVDAAGLPLPAGARVLDVGCGPGTLTVALAEARAYRIDGLDLSPEMIAHATRNGEASPAAVRLNFTVGDVRDLPFPDGTFDLVISSMSQHHWADPVAGVREIRRVLKPGGRAWIYDARFAFSRLGKGQPSSAQPADGQPSDGRHSESRQGQPSKGRLSEGRPGTVRLAKERLTKERLTKERGEIVKRPVRTGRLPIKWVARAELT
jgi:SAM-dependent methyltransferase